MNPVTLIAFDDEMQKIASSLNALQLASEEGKGLKRGWDAARRQKSTMRLLHRAPEERKAFYAANKAGGATSIGRRFKPPVITSPATQASKPGQTAKRIGQGLGIGGVGVAVGASLQHRHDSRQEIDNARPHPAVV